MRVTAVYRTPTPESSRLGAFGLTIGAMDWFRRNWPDLLIGVALVAVIAMIVATLLSGGSLASLVRRDGSPELPLTDTTGTAGNPVTGSNADAAGTAATPGEDTTATNPAQTPDDFDVFVPEVPGQEVDNGAGRASTGTGVEAAALQDGTQSLAGATSQANGTLPEASASGGYRVAAGATPSRDAASDLAQSYRDGGYEVAVEQQNDFYALWIGPYATRADADSAAERIIAAGGDALVHNYDGEDETAANGSDDTNTTSAQPGTATPDTATVATGTNEAAEITRNEAAEITGAELANAGNLDGDSVATNNVATGSVATGNTGTQQSSSSLSGAGERFLQVGAFASNESAQPLRSQLEGLGLDVTRSEDASGLVRLFVGPFGGTQLAQTQQRLTAEGIVDSFPVTR